MTSNMQDTETADRPDILVVDDSPDNLRVICRLLKERQYRVRPVPNGRLALRAAVRRPPDLVLLDVNMPDMDGYEVCRRLREEPTLRDVPVIFLSAMSQVPDKVRAFDTGAVDYVTKPFQIDDVVARIDTHLRLRRLQRELAQANGELRATNEKLARLETIRDLTTHLIVHDMRSPLTVILTHLRLSLDDRRPHLLDPTDVQSALDSGTTLMRMINDMIDISRLESEQMVVNMERHELVALVQQSVDSISTLLRGVRVHVLASRRPARAHCDAELVRRVMVNLLTNARSVLPHDGVIEVQVDARGMDWRVEVRDDGPGIPAEHLARIFDKYAQVDGERPRRGPSSGLGLTFCKLAITAMTGRIGVESTIGRGTAFWFTLPRDAPAGAY